MQAKIQKWGNSQGLRFTKDLLASARLDAHSQRFVVYRHGLIMIFLVARDKPLSGLLLA